MATGLKLPPLPWGSLDFKDPQWQDWFKALRNYVVTTGVSWDGINFTGSALSDIQTRPHSALQTILGSGAYHLSLDKYNVITNSQSGTWSPSSSGFTFTGTPVVTASYTKFDLGVEYWIKITADSITTSGATLSLPYPATQDSIVTSLSSAGIGYTSVLDAASDVINVPAVSGVTYLLLTGTYKA